MHTASWESVLHRTSTGELSLSLETESYILNMQYVVRLKPSLRYNVKSAINIVEIEFKKNLFKHHQYRY